MTRLALLVALLVPASAWAAAAAVAGAWSPPVDGISVRLVATRTFFREGADTGREIEGRLELALDLRNGSRQTKTLRVVPPAVFELPWEIVATDGTHYRPTYFPPGPPRPGDRREKLVLKAGEERRWVSLYGISGFHRVDEPLPDGRRFQVLPPGEYRVRLTGVRLAGLKAALVPGPITIIVMPADERVDGLRLVLAADRAATSYRTAGGAVDPVRLTLTIVNEGKKLLRIAPHDLARRLTTWDLHGSYSSTAAPRGTPPPATAADYRLIKPGERVTLVAEQPFPGPLGRRQVNLSGRGWYSLRAIVTRPATEPCPVTDCWSGVLSSKVLWVRVR